MKKKIFIVGGGYADIPIIKAAKQLGFFVITGGLDKNGLGNRYSDLYCRADNSDQEAVLKVARDQRVDVICPSAAGYSAVSCAYAAEKLGHDYLDSYEAARTLHYKDSFQKLAKELALPSPKAESFKELGAAKKAVGGFGFPLIIKPVDMSGGKGIVRAGDAEEAEAAVINAFARSKVGNIIIEEFIEGSNHGFSSIIRGGKVAFYFVDNEYYYLNKYTVAGTTTPGDVPREAVASLIFSIEKLASVLSLKNGLFHLQFILRNGRPFIIDICRRVPGDLYVEFVKYATGVDYPSFIVKSYAGMKIDDLAPKPASGHFTRHVIMGDRNGTFSDIKIGEALKGNIIDRLSIFSKGGKVSDFMTQRLGVVIIKYGSQREADDKNGRIQELIKAEVSE
jgi:biotin carboxylase